MYEQVDKKLDAFEQNAFRADEMLRHLQQRFVEWTEKLSIIDGTVQGQVDETEELRKTLQ